MATDIRREQSGATAASSAVRSLLTPDHAWAAMRIIMGWLFIWAFVDRLFGLGFATEVGWIDGGSPTFGLMTASTHGLLDGLYARLAGNGLVDLLFMAGLGGAGLALILGIGVRIAAVVGAALQVFMWSLYLPPASDPFIDAHMFEAVALIGIAIANAGTTWGFGRQWQSVPLVRRFPVLK